MPTFQFEAMDATGAEIKDVIEAPTEEEAQATIRQMGYFVTKITAKKARKKAEATGGKKKRGFVFGGVKSRDLTTFTRQLSILQDAGLPILRSLRILAGQAKAGPAQVFARRHLRRNRRPARRSPKAWPRAPSASTGCT